VIGRQEARRRVLRPLREEVGDRAGKWSAEVAIINSGYVDTMAASTRSLPMPSRRTSRSPEGAATLMQSPAPARTFRCHEKMRRGFAQTMAKAHGQLSELAARLERSKARRSKAAVEAEDDVSP
jgi:hypothetical protein